MNPEIWNGFDGNGYIAAISGDTCQQAGGEDVSAPRDQQVESTETETSGTQGTARLSNLVLKAALCVAFFSVVSVVILFVLFPFPSSTVYPPCSHEPSVDTVTWPTWDGYELEIAGLSRARNLDAYKIAVLKDGTPWAGFPKIVVNGAIGTGPAGEYLNFTDLTSDGKLTGGDFFTLENLTSGSQYEFILLWTSTSCKLTSEVINVP